MRNPKRIKEILKLLEQLWKSHPDMRFGQLLINYVYGDKINWNLEDDELKRFLNAKVKGDI